MSTTITRTADPTLASASDRDRVRTQIGRKTASEIRDWASNPVSGADRGWAHSIADRLALSGFLTLADVTDEEFDEILA